MKTVLFQFRADKKDPSVESVNAQFNLPDTAIDREFGVMETDSSQQLYVVMVDASQREQIEIALARKPARHPAEGFFSNPPIEPV